MKQKKLMFLVAIFATVTALIASSATAMALQIDANDSDISLEFGKDPKIPLINPNNPSQEQQGDDPSNIATNQVGELTIDQVPATLDFGSHRAGSGPDTFNLNPSSLPASDSPNSGNYVVLGRTFKGGHTASDSPNSGNYVVQFSDFRVNSGYSVLPKVSIFSDGKGTDMEGASINFATPTGRAAYEDDPFIHGEIFGYTPQIAYLNEPTAFSVKAVAGSTGDPVTIFKGMPGDNDHATGKGSWKVLYNPRDITLTVPPKFQKTGIFNSSITWIIIPGTDG